MSTLAAISIPVTSMAITRIKGGVFDGIYVANSLWEPTSRQSIRCCSPNATAARMQLFCRPTGSREAT